MWGHKWCVPAGESGIDFNRSHYHRGESSLNQLMEMVNCFYNQLLYHNSLNKKSGWEGSVTG